MSRLAGQAARGGMARGGSVLMLLARVALGLLLLAVLGAGGLAWRLSRGPLDLPWLARRAAQAASTPDRTIGIGQLRLAWTGAGTLRLLLSDVTASGGFGEATLARAEVALPVTPLLGGHVEPETVDLSGLDLRLHRPSVGPAAAPHAAPGSALARLHRVRIQDVSAAMDGVPGRIEQLDVDLERTDAGGVAGHAGGVLTTGAESATLTLSAQTDGRGTDMQASLTPVTPARLAGAAPELAPLAALDAPVTVAARAKLGPALELIEAHATLGVGAGTVHAGTGTAPILAAELTVDATADRAALVLVRLDAAPTPDGPRTRFSGHAEGARAADGAYSVAAALDVDRVAVADLPALWPEGTGGPGTRPWMTKNITAGEMSDGHVELELSIPADFSDAALRRIDGRIDGHDLTVHWLRPVPPIEHGEARLTISDPDVIDVAVPSATQSGGRRPLRISDGLVHLTGIAGRSQFADIRNMLSGELADLLTVLSNKRIKLLSKRPVPMHDPAGEITAQLHIGRLPLRDDVSMDDLMIDATMRATGVHLGGIAAGYDLSRGTLDLSANNDGLTVDGRADLAGFPSLLKIGMDFRTGPPEQVQQSVTARSTIALARLSEFGIDAGSQLGGSVQLDTTVMSRRNGRTDIALAADLAAATVNEPLMGIAKRAGEVGSASAKVALQGDRLLSIEQVRVAAPGISVQADALIEDGSPQGVRVDRLMLGTGTNLTGEVRMPADGGPVAVRLSGPSLDLSPALRGGERPGFGNGPGGGSGSSMGGRAWSADLAIGRVVLGPDRALLGLRASGRSDGRVLQRADITGRVAGAAARGGAIAARIAPDAGGRRLTVDLADAGALLAAAGVTKALLGGHLNVTARWADGRPAAPLAGVAEMTDFRIRDAPTIGRVLQGLTIYGLVELARGPGVAFSRMVAPFAWQDSVLSLHDAQAFSPSLGFTAQGRIDMGRRVADLNGTVVPVYFFNSLLGRVPLIGKLFTAEPGGGLIAMTVAITGKLDDLSVRANPLSALTPGLLRRLFGSGS